MMVFSSIHFPANNTISFSFMAKWYSIVYIFFIHLLIDGHLGWFHSLTVVNVAAINVSV
jgi:hypothetical protein